MSLGEFQPDRDFYLVYSKGDDRCLVVVWIPEALLSCTNDARKLALEPTSREPKGERPKYQSKNAPRHATSSNTPWLCKCATASLVALTPAYQVN